MGGTPLQRPVVPAPALGKAADSKPSPILRDGDKPRLGAGGGGDNVHRGTRAGNTRLLRSNTQLPGAWTALFLKPRENGLCCREHGRPAEPGFWGPALRTLSHF